MVSIFKSGICRTDQLEKMAEFLDTRLARFIMIGKYTDGAERGLHTHVNRLEEAAKLAGNELKEAKATIERLDNLVSTQEKYIKLLEEKLENVNHK